MSMITRHNFTSKAPGQVAGWVYGRLKFIADRAQKTKNAFADF